MSVTSKEEDPSLLNLNDHLRPENRVITKESVRKFIKNSLELVPFKRLDSIRLSRSKWLVTNFLVFFCLFIVFC